jgi:hypothetical protein
MHDVPLLLKQYVLSTFEIITVMLRHIQPFWDVICCRPVNSYQHFLDIVAVKMRALRTFEMSTAIYQPRQHKIVEEKPLRASTLETPQEQS